MTEETTFRPQQIQQDMGPKMQEEMPQPQMQQAQQARRSNGVMCPNCGTVNDPDAMYCESCGALLRMNTCPNCGSELDPEADFCEVCHRYIRHDLCSFCGARIDGQDAFCPECGSPRGGIVCPTCHTLNDFAFCKQCGQPLTDEARQILTKLKQLPEYQMLTQLAHEYNELQMRLPYLSDRDRIASEDCEQLRLRVLRLLAQDAGVPNIDIPEQESPRMSKDELDALKAEKMRQLTELLNSMAIPPQSQPAKVRNYAMAQKPAGVRLAWKCNYKSAMHSSPCGCAKPQMGGKWVVLGSGMFQEIKDDK